MRKGLGNQFCIKPRPLILGIETSSSLCSVCFWREGSCLSYEGEDIGFGHASTFFALLERAQKSSGLRLKDVTHIAVTRGPGSFTGIRVGLSIAKGLELAGGLTLLGLTCFEVGLQTLPHAPITFFALDTKRNDFYGALYEEGRCIETGIWTEDDVLRKFHESFQESPQGLLQRQQATLVTDKLEVFSTLPAFVTRQSFQLTARDVAQAAEHYLSKEVDIFSKDPFYLRPPKVYE